MTYSALFVGFLVALPLWRFTVGTVQGVGIRIDWLVGALIVVVFASQWVSGRRRLRHARGLGYLLLLHLALILSIHDPLMSGQAGRLVDWTTLYLQYLLTTAVFAVVASLRLDRADVFKILRVYFAVVAVVAVYGIAQFLASGLGVQLRLPYTNPLFATAESGYEGATGPFNRAFSVFLEPRQFGSYVISAFVIPLIALSFRFSPYRQKSTLPLLCMAALGGLAAATSTSAIFITLLSLVLVVLAVILNRDTSTTAGRGTILVLLVVGGAAFAYVLATGQGGFLAFYRGRISLPDLELALRHVQTLDVSRHGWFGYLGNAALSVTVFSEHPLTGVGLNNLDYFSIGPFHGAHGIFRLMAETGVLGVGALGLVFAHYGRKMYNLTIMVRKEFPHALEDNALAFMALFLFLIAILKSFASIFSFSSTFFWADMALAFLVYNHLEAKYAEPARRTARRTAGRWSAVGVRPGAVARKP